MLRERDLRYAVLAVALSGVSALTVSRSSVELPKVWSSYRTINSLDEDFRDLKTHGVGLVSIQARDVAEAKAALSAARRNGMQYHIAIPDVTESGSVLRGRGFDLPDALMIGGVYRGLAMDRHLFRFTAASHSIVIEPPVYNKRFPYTLGSRGSGKQAAGEPIGHYFPDMPDPVRAEIVVPLRMYDGAQHLRVIPAEIRRAEAEAQPEDDTVAPDFPPSSETRSRRLYRLTFDLSGLDNAMLDHIGLAVYWPYRGTDRYWIFGKGTIPASSEKTHAALRAMAGREIELWKSANGGEFPSDVIRAIRYGDECFYITGGSGVEAPAVNYPLWDYSADGIASFRRSAGGLEYPRTWGFPEIYGPQAYGIWLYSLHRDCAGLLDTLRKEIAVLAPGLLVFRNMTRYGVFHLANDHDGSGPELLSANIDIIHLDPYPVNASGYSPAIPRDMSYYAGLARRYDRLLIPWMQAHIYGGPGGLQHVSPQQVDQMMREQRAQGVDAVMWLGYGEGQTFPKVRPDSWRRAGELHAEFVREARVKPKAQLALVRGYEAWALHSFSGRAIRNPADWLLQQLAEVWAVENGQPYDVFEVPPSLTSAQVKDLEARLSSYRFVAGTVDIDHPCFWRLGKGTEGQRILPEEAVEQKRSLGIQLRDRGWLAGETRDLKTSDSPAQKPRAGEQQ